MWKRNKFSVKLSRHVNHQLSGGGERRASEPASEYHSEGAAEASRLLGEPSFGKSRRSNSGARLLFFPPFHRHAAEHKENGATSCRQQEPAETRIPQDSSKQRFQTRVTEIHPVGKGSRQPSRLTCSSTLPAALKQKKHNVAAQDLYLPTTGLS